MHRSHLLTIWLSGVVVTALAFFLGRSLENAGLEARFRPAAENQASRLATVYRDYLQEADSVRRLFESSVAVDGAEFAAFTRPALTHRPGILGFYYVAPQLEAGIRIRYQEERYPTPGESLPLDLLTNSLRSGQVVASLPVRDSLTLAVPVYERPGKATGIVVVRIAIKSLLEEAVERQILPLPMQWFDVSAAPGHTLRSTD